MFTFLHAADIHLDSPLLKLEHYDGAPVEDLRSATRRALENLVELAIVERVDFVLIAGDLYDGDWKDYNTGLYFVSRMTKLREAGIPVYIIAGNHDAASKMTKTLRLPDKVFLFPTDKPATVHLEDIGVAIHGQGFAKQAVSKDLSAGYPSAVPGCFNIGMLHTCATGREGHESYAPCKIDGLLSKDYDYWALGHVHKKEVLHEDPLIVFPGNIQGRQIRETGPRGCMLVTVDDSGRANADFRPLDVIRWMRCNVDASGADRSDDVVDRICEQIKELFEQSDLPLVTRIEVEGSCRAHAELSADPEHWTNEIRSAAMDLSNGRIWIEKVRLRTNPLSKGKVSEPADGPVGEILHLLDEVRSEPAWFGTLGESLNDFWKKLPREIREGKDAISPANTEWLTNMLDQVRPMLLRRLVSSRLVSSRLVSKGDAP
jgi:DNA repair exonuclease SbcCD nuclease subunit